MLEKEANTMCILRQEGLEEVPKPWLLATEQGARGYVMRRVDGVRKFDPYATAVVISYLQKVSLEDEEKKN